MNNEPVAWMWYESKENTNPYTQMTGYSQLCFSEFKPDCNVVVVDDGTLTPLYTHPVKELTDEEILDFIGAFCLDMGDYWDLHEKNAIPMIRAILRKAQEK